MTEKMKMYIKTRDGSPVIEVGSDKHRPFTQENLDSALDVVSDYAIKLREVWNEDDWFPCGFVNLKVRKGSELHRFIVDNDEYNIVEYPRMCKYRCLSMSRQSDYDDENELPLYMVIEKEKDDAIMSQCMRYKQRVYEQLQVLLAFMSVTTGLETRID